MSFKIILTQMFLKWLVSGESGSNTNNVSILLTAKELKLKLENFNTQG